MMSISKFYDFNFQRMARTRGGMSKNQNRGRGRGRARARGRGIGVQPEDVILIERADVSVRSQMSIRESSPSSASERLQLAMASKTRLSACTMRAAACVDRTVMLQRVSTRYLQ